MSIRLQMAGTGSAFAKKYYNNNALVQAGNYTLMIDFGITAPMALHAMQHPMDAVDAVLITHLHADHIGGLEEYAYQMKYKYQRKPLLYIPSTLIKPLWENSLKAGMEDVTEGAKELADFFDVISLNEDVPVELCEGLTVQIMKTRHIPNRPSYSLLINGMLFYSADTVFDKELLTSLCESSGCKYILHDCQLQPPGNVHATLAELLTLPKAIQRRIYLMHYSDEMEEYVGRTGFMQFLEQHKTYVFD